MTTELREARLAADLSLESAARAAELSSSQLSRLELGRLERPDLERSRATCGQGRARSAAVWAGRPGEGEPDRTDEWAGEVTEDPRNHDGRHDGRPVKDL